MPSLPLAGSDARTVETTGPAQQESCQEALTGEDPMFETQYEALRRQGISRRSFLQFCSLTAASLGIGSAGAKDIAEAMETKPRTPVIWLHGLECTCCTESFIRSYHPVAKDLVLSMISLDYDDTIMAAAGHQAEAALEDTIEKYKGNYILAVEGNVPLNDDGVNCIPGGETFLRKIKHVAAGAKAVIGWGSCAAWGCVQAAKPNPTHAVPITEIITDKPIVLVPGCPPIPEVMTGVVTYILTYDRLPPLDRMGRPKMFYGQRIHDKCYRRAHFDAGQFVEKFDDEGAKLGYCLYKVGCKGPPARPSAGTRASPGRSSQATAASAAPSPTSSTRAPSTSTRRRSCLRAGAASRRPPTRWASRRSASSASRLPRTWPCPPCRRPAPRRPTRTSEVRKNE